ncbi:MAG TPA: DUF1570 domain-containing protein [Gemmataceae bacterium]|jgi:hypothetical protein
MARSSAAPTYRSAAGVLLAVGVLLAADAPTEPEWKFDQVRLKNGAVLRGLILDETPAGVRFENIRRHPGRPTVRLTATFAPAEIASIDHLSDADRAELKARLKALEEAAPAEKQRADRLDLEPIPWAGKPAAGRRYVSDHFVLESDAAEGVVRRAAVRVEQVFATYARYLPPRAERPKPTVIELFQSRAGYEARLQAQGRTFVNVACYDPAANRILCYSDLGRLGDDLERQRQEHQRIRADLDQHDKELARLYRGADLARVRTVVRDARRKLAAADRDNEAIFDRATRQLFAVLYHEAFHAYLANAAYAPPQSGPPRWLNEGLAQVFESAVVEGGQLRVDHADRARLAKAQDAVRKGDLVPLPRLLRSVSRDFLAAHAADRAATDIYYLTAWAVATELMFDRRLLGTPALDDYFAALARGADPEAAFADLVGRPVPEYEAALRQYLLNLRPD